MRPGLVVVVLSMLTVNRARAGPDGLARQVQVLAGVPGIEGYHLVRCQAVAPFHAIRDRRPCERDRRPACERLAERRLGKALGKTVHARHVHQLVFDGQVPVESRLQRIHAHDAQVDCRHELGQDYRRVDEWMDYIYIYWPDGERMPTNYPWIFERRLSHHGGGIHVAPIAGRAFWDKDARWLKEFAASHPELEIPMPEDMQ